MPRQFSMLCAAVACLVLAVATPAPTTFEVIAAPLPPADQQRELTIDVFSNPNMLRPKVGLPDFTIAGGDAALKDIGGTIVEVLWRDLEFEREFYMIPRKESASIPLATTPDTLPFARWSQLGADMVLLGSIRPGSGKQLTVEVRVISVKPDSPGRQEFGQSYDGCTTDNPRYCAHYIADDIHKKMRDVDGVARTKLAFASDRDATRMSGRKLADSGQGKEIYISDYDGAGQRRITINQSLNIAPKWGPDQRTLAYTSYVSSFPDVYVMLFDGRAPTRPGRGDDRAQNMLPAISPDGAKVAFASNRSGNWDVWVVNRDGSDARNLTPNTPSIESAPTWSPTGGQIAFTSDRTGSNQIYVMNAADGLGLRRLTSERKSDRPTWSTLNYIAYTTEGGAGTDIAVIDLAGSQTRVITDGRGKNESPAVAPNGRHILFVTTRWGREHLAIIDIDGKNVRQITEVGNNTYPSWSPLPK